jgi:hypothetical protein
MLQRRALTLVFTFVVACGGGGTHPPPNSSPIDQPTVTALSGGLGAASLAVGARSPQSALVAQAAILALKAGVQASDVSLTAALRGAGPAPREALSSGAARAFGFQLQVENLAGTSGTQTFSGVLLFAGASDWVLVAGPSPGSPIPPAVGLLGAGTQLWQATAGSESAQLQSEGSTCPVSLPAGVTSCKLATFTNAGFNITSSVPASTDATGSRTASLAAGSLGAGVSLVVDCSVFSLCPGSTAAQVYVAPSTFTLGPGGARQFAATVVGNGITGNGVTWSVDESGGGTITSSGEYTAPTTPGTFHVRATSVAVPTASGVATVTVTTSTGIVVRVSPNPTSVAIRGSVFFESSVSGTDDTAVSWSVDEAGGGTIASNGAYSAPASTGTFHVRATSVVDPGASGVATVNVTGYTVTVSAQPVTTDSLSNLDCLAEGGPGPFTYAWHGYRDDGDTSGVSFSNASAQAPQVNLSTTSTFGSNFYLFCVLGFSGSPVASGYAVVTLGTAIPKVMVSPTTIHAGATSVTFDGTTSIDAQAAFQWTVDYGGNVTPASLEDYLKIAPAQWTAVFTDSSPSSLVETVSAAKFTQPGAYRVQLVLTSSNDFTQVEGTFYFQVVP